MGSKILVQYQESLAADIKELFIKLIVPSNFLLAVTKYSRTVLTHQDISRLRKKLEREIDEDVNVDLLGLLIRYEGWFECILKVLSDPDIKQGHLVKEFQQLKREHDLKWNFNHPKNDELTPVSESNYRNTIESQSTDVPSVEPNGVLEESVVNSSLCSDSVESLSNHTSESKDWSMTNSKGKCHVLSIDLTSKENKDQHVSATDMPSVETNGIIEESVVNRSLCSDPVRAFANLSLSESKDWSMKDGKGKCYVCNIDLTSEQNKNQHLSGKLHKKRLERNSLDGGNKVDTTQAEGDEVVDAAERKDLNFCHACTLPLTSPEHAKQHYEGRNHRNKVYALKRNETASRDVSFSEGSVNGDEDEEDATEKRDPKFCLACNLALTSPEHAKQHYEGKNHKKKLDALKVKPTSYNTDIPAQGDNETYSLDACGKGFCKVCDVAFTSVQNAQDHLDGKNHKKKMSRN